jgi:hypothetical protein
MILGAIVRSVFQLATIDSNWQQLHLSLGGVFSILCRFVYHGLGQQLRKIDCAHHP